MTSQKPCRMGRVVCERDLGDNLQYNFDSLVQGTGLRSNLLTCDMFLQWLFRGEACATTVASSSIFAQPAVLTFVGALLWRMLCCVDQVTRW